MRVTLISALAIAVAVYAAPANAERAQHLQMSSAGRLLAQIDLLNEEFCAAFLERMRERFSAGMASKCVSQRIEEGLDFRAVLRMTGSPHDSDAYFPSQQACEGFTLAIARGSFVSLMERCRPR